MVTSLLRVVLPPFLILGSMTACAAPEPFSCPAELGPTEQKALQTPAGWSATVEGSGPARHALTGFMINLGPVTKSDGAIYDDLRQKKDGQGGVTETATWKVDALDDAYAVCTYHRTAVVLSRPLKGYTECRMVQERKRDSAFRLKEAGCR
ncbi:STY0301 family protein [Roseateles sp.]|uniref:STY0301 family protein n=1 Tax=Roseateles sp. TaxID=1971397 RepID=UPI0031DE6F5A